MTSRATSPAMSPASIPTLPGTAAGPVGVDELKRAWRAVAAGEFRTGSGTNGHRRLTAAAAWTPEPGECTLAVLGCAGSAGATTVALAVGLAARGPVRVLECGSLTTSSLAAASTAELGLHPDGWLQGRREHVLLERASEILSAPATVPLPIPAPGGQPSEVDDDEPGSSLTILDAGWEAGQLLTTESWLAEAVRDADHLVLTTRATIPGMRRLEAVLDLLTGTREPDRINAAVIGARRKKWPRGLDRAGGPNLRRLLAGNCVEIPDVPALAVTGLDSRPLPPSVVAAARRLLPPQHHPPGDTCDTDHTR